MLGAAGTVMPSASSETCSACERSVHQHARRGHAARGHKRSPRLFFFARQFSSQLCVPSRLELLRASCGRLLRRATIAQPALLLGCSPPGRIPLERALARVRREAGARVAQNVRLADMNLDASVQDARRIGSCMVVCNGLPLWHGAQLAVDATIVSLVGRGADTRPALALARRCRLVVFGVEVGGHWSREAAPFVRLFARAPAARRATACGAWVPRWTAAPATSRVAPRATGA